MSYKSILTGQTCKPAHLIAEIMCDREAKKKKIMLPSKFWNTEEWKKKYKLQIISATALLKVYSPELILKTLNRKDCQWQYSLRESKFLAALNEEQINFDKQQKTIEQSVKVEVNNPNVFKQINTGQTSKKARLD